MGEEWFRHELEITTVCTSEESTKNEKYANVSVGVRLMVRGGCLPVRGSKRMEFIR